jgi:ethanolamine ammonia-lyase small subunit
MSFEDYKKYTQARIGLGHSGPSLPTHAWLDFSYQHAAAVDAIRVPWQIEEQLEEIKNLNLHPVIINSDVRDREDYLLRPDKGRRLHEDSRSLLQSLKISSAETLLIAASNGLSSFAVKNHLAPFLKALIAQLKIPVYGDKVFLLPNGRVGIMDDIGEILEPAVGIMIIGERPGLSSPDSLAVYLTFNPKKGLSDADRNCISNIRIPHGLTYQEAAFKTNYLIHESLRRRLSGVSLKDESHLISE